MEEHRECASGFDSSSGKPDQEIDIPTPLEAIQADIDGTPYPEEILRQTIAVSQFRSAPLPTPQEFGQYEGVLSGAADRILGMSEKALEAQCYAVKSDADAEAKALKATAFAYALALPLSIVAVIAGSYFESLATVIAASVVAIIEASPKAIDAILKHRKAREDGA